MLSLLIFAYICIRKLGINEIIKVVSEGWTYGNWMVARYQREGIFSFFKVYSSVLLSTFTLSHKESPELFILQD